MEVVEIKIEATEQLVDITNQVKEFIGKSRLKKGIVQLQVPEKTSALAILCNDDQRLEREFFKKINHLLPKYDGMMFTGWTTASVKAALFGTSKSLMVESGTLILDLNQSLYFIEFHGPGERSILMTSMGDSFEEDESPKMPDPLAKLYKKRQQVKDEEAKAIEEMRQEWQKA